MTLQTIADIAGDNAKHQLVATAIRARQVILTSSGAASRFGDTNVGAARGVKLPTDVPVVVNASGADIADMIPMDGAYVYVPSGATVTVTYAA